MRDLITKLFAVLTLGFFLVALGSVTLSPSAITEPLNVGGGTGTINSLPVRNFLGLTDTPNSYSGQSGKVVAVNGAENALEFITSGSGLTIGTTTITSGTDTRVLFNDGGVVGEDAGFTFTKATDTLNLATGIKTMSDVPLHITNSGSTSGVLIGNVVGVANRAFVGANTSSSYLVLGTGTTGLLFINNGGNTFRGSIGDGGNWRIASDATIATAKLEVEATSGGSQKALVINSSTSTGDTLELQDNGTDVFSIGDGGIGVHINNSGGTSVTQTINGNASTGSILDLTNAVAGTPATLSFLGVSTQNKVRSNYSLLLEAGGSGGPAGYLDLNYGSGLSHWANYSARQKLTLNYNAATTTTKNSSYIFTQAIGNASAGYGNGITLAGTSATVAARDMVRLSGVWTTATDASRTSAMTFDTVTSAGSLTEGMRLSGDVLSLVGSTTQAGELRFLEDTDDGANYTSFKAVAQAGDIVYTLPPDDGDAGEQLQTNGSGALTWEAAGGGGGGTPGGSDTYVQFNDASSFGGDAGLTYNKTTDALTAVTFIGALTGNASTATALAADPADCGANTFADAINASGTLTCNAVVSADITDGTITLADTAITAGRSLTISTNDILADAELYTDVKTIYFESPTASDDFKTIWVAPLGTTITKISCESDQTVNFDLQIDDGTPAGVNGSDIACTVFATDSTLAGDTTMALGDRMDLAITSVSGTPTWVSISFEYSYDD